MTVLPRRERAGASDADPLDRRPHQPLPEYTNEISKSSVSEFSQKRRSLRSRASIRLAEMYRLAHFRRQNRLTINANTFAFVLAATLACGSRGSILIRGRVNREAKMEARPRVIPWSGLDLAALREGVKLADLGEIGDDELSTIIEAVRLFQEHNGTVLIGAAQLGKMLGLTSVERAECRIGTIEALDEPRAERLVRQREEKKVRDTTFNRTQRGRSPRPVYLEQAGMRRRFCLEKGISDRTLRRWIKAGKVDVRSATFTDILSLRHASDLGHVGKKGDRQPVAGPARLGGARQGPCADGPSPGARPTAAAPRRSRRATACGEQVADDGDHDGGPRDAGAVLALIAAARAIITPEASITLSLGLGRVVIEATAEASPHKLDEAVRIVAANLARLLQPYAANDNRLAPIVQRLAA